MSHEPPAAMSVASGQEFRGHRNGQNHGERDGERNKERKAFGPLTLWEGAFRGDKQSAVLSKISMVDRASWPLPPSPLSRHHKPWPR